MAASESASFGARLAAFMGSAGGLLLTGFAAGVLLTLFVTGDDAPLEQPALEIVRARDGGTVHAALNGRPVLVKAVLAPRPGRALASRFEFGDGSDPVEGEVLDPYAVSAVHQYPESPAGTRFTARLTVTDRMSGESAAGTYEIEIVEPTLDNRVSVALDDALFALHARMTRRDDPRHGPIGFWNEGDHPVGSTALAALAFCVNGFDGRAEREQTPYRETVDRAFNFLLAQLETVEIAAQPAGDPDSNGNGLGVRVIEGGQQLYEAPLVTMALAASLDPERSAPAGGNGILGRSFFDLVRDLADFIAFAQTDGDDSIARGGWRYRENTHDADMSVSQWPVLAFMSAHETFGIDAPDWVKRELGDHFLARVQGASGGFGYTGPDDRVTMRLLGAGLIAQTFAGLVSSHERMQRAVRYAEANWDSTNVGDYYAMYALMKGARLADPEITAFGAHDWRTEYAEHLCTSQAEDGTWPGGGSYAPGVLKTALPALVLSKDIFFAARPTSLLWRVIVPAAAALALLLAGGAFVLIRRRRAEPTP